MRWYVIPLSLLLLIFFSIAAARGDGAPRVVASITPVHGLVARIMDGVARPELLIPGNVSPHAYSLKPSDAELLEAADVVFWIGPGLEASLSKPLEVLASGARVASLMDDRDRATMLLPRRKGGILDHNDGQGSDSGAGTASLDPHIWLNPQNAAAMMLNIAEVLAGVDPANANLYLSNALDGAQELDALSRDIEQRLAGLKASPKPFVFFHDAYQYFEQRFDIAPVAVIRVDPDHAPGARRVGEIRAAIEQVGAACVFSEPQFDPRLISNLIENTQASHSFLDPMGSGIPLGRGFYTAMMMAFVDDLTACLYN